MFPGPAQRKHIDKIGQIFSGFLSTRFRGPNPSNLRMFEKWKQYCWQVFLRAFFWCDLRKTNQNSFIMSPNFPWPALQKKLYIYISIFVQFFCRRFSRDQPSKKINICIYIYIVFFVFLFSFFSPIFPQPALPSHPKKNIHFVHFFVADLPAASPPKNISLKKIKHIFFQFCNRWFSRHQPSIKYNLKKDNHIHFVHFFAADFPATSPPKKIKV